MTDTNPHTDDPLAGELGNTPATPAGDDFWQTAADLSDFSGPPFYLETEKRAAIDAGTILHAQAISEMNTQNGPKWFITIVDENGEQRTCTFTNGGGTFSRDIRLQEMQEWLHAHPGKLVPFKIGEQGKARLILGPNEPNPGATKS